MRILVVDDDPDVLEVVATALKHLGFEAVAVGSAEEARGRLSTERFELALIDTPMVALSGIALANRLTAANVPVLMMAAGEDMIERLKVANLAYIMKPFSPDLLLSAIRSLTARSTGPPGPSR
jgi:two-component system, OmpR family, response regulator